MSTVSLLLNESSYLQSLAKYSKKVDFLKNNRSARLTIENAGLDSCRSHDKTKTCPASALGIQTSFFQHGVGFDNWFVLALVRRPSCQTRGASSQCGSEHAHQGAGLGHARAGRFCQPTGHGPKVCADNRSVHGQHHRKLVGLLTFFRSRQAACDPRRPTDRAQCYNAFALLHSS